MNFFDLITEVAARFNFEDMLFCVIYWHTWYLRNSFIQNGNKPDYQDVFWWSRDFVAKSQVPSVVKNERGIMGSRGHPYWRAPSHGFYRINCSVVSEVGKNRVGIGVIMCNDSAFVMASCCQFLVANFDSIVVEMVAISKGISFSKDCGLSPCVLESNKAEEIDRVLNNKFRNASYG
ncbi:hypothetical protein LWI29_028797 [Acer saccharum]|uniref:RNase H type-1 domain-containing protein n=1 Tax=Acer saccharum TaxID=4024 RepID=A0AA39RIK4_ACESA|nr:hypothetical protein LWI29_028797 [Acer saccharum]